MSACVFATKGIADFGSFRIGEIWANVKLGFVPGLQVGAVLALGWLVVSVGLPFYLSLGGIPGALAAGVLFWCAVIVLLALQYYVPLRSRLGGGLRKNLRKSFVIFFDNPGFSSSSSCIPPWLRRLPLPGLPPARASPACLAQNVALRLRMLKYDWLEAQPGANRREVPWDDLLEGTRSSSASVRSRACSFPGRSEPGIHD